MTFNDWFAQVGLTAYAISKLTGLSHLTIQNILRGQPPTMKTVKVLVRVTKHLPNPVFYEMFPRVYLPGQERYAPAIEALKTQKKKAD